MLHFAPRYGIISPCLVRPRAVRLTRAANDNGAALAGRRKGANDSASEQEAQEAARLAAALRLFAAHGLSAAQRACDAAEIAADGGDSAGAAWWIAVCATLDGPMARDCAARANQLR